MKRLKKILKNGTIGVIGFILSPLSWWNDLFVNIPIAYGAAWLWREVFQSGFLGAFIVSYWLTNVAGLVMMHYGVTEVVKRKEDERARRPLSSLVKHIAISVVYTVVMVALIQLHVLQSPTAYFNQ